MSQLNSVSEKKDYRWLDIIKLVCAFLVVVVHSNVPGSQSAFWKLVHSCFTEQAVPFFFITSGFFFAKKMYSCSPNDVLKNIWKNFKDRFLLYLCWLVFWSVYLIKIYFNKYDSFLYALLTLFRRCFLVGHGVYWYILVLAEAILVLGFFIYLKKEKLLYILAAVGIALRFVFVNNINFFVFGYFNRFIKFVFESSNNIIMAGIPLMTIGLIFARIEFSKIKIIIPSITYIFACIANVVCYLYNFSNSLLDTLIYLLMPINLFLIFANLNSSNINKKFSLCCRNLSTVIYYMHTVFILGVITKVFGSSPPVHINVFVSILLSCLVYILVEVINIRFFSWVFSIKPTKCLKKQIR